MMCTVLASQSIRSLISNLARPAKGIITILRALNGFSCFLSQASMNEDSRQAHICSITNEASDVVLSALLKSD